MKRLTLIRHGKSSWASLTQDDFVRPLNSRGLRDCTRMPGVISASIARPQRLLSSTALRAKMTSEAIAEGYGLSLEEITYLPALYLASQKILLQCLREQDNALDHLMLVGHNPGLTEIYNYLCPEQADDLPTFAVVDLHLQTASWEEIDGHDASVQTFLKPKLLG